MHCLIIKNHTRMNSGVGSLGSINKKYHVRKKALKSFIGLGIIYCVSYICTVRCYMGDIYININIAKGRQCSCLKINAGYLIVSKDSSPVVKVVVRKEIDIVSLVKIKTVGCYLNVTCLQCTVI